MTWPRRTAKPFAPRALPAGCAFGDKGPSAFVQHEGSPALLLGVLSGAPTRLLLSGRLAASDDHPGAAAKSYEVGLIKELPLPAVDPREAARLETAAAFGAVATALLQAFEEGEIVTRFAIPAVLATPGAEFDEAVDGALEVTEGLFGGISHAHHEIDSTVSDLYRFNERDLAVLWEELEPPLTQLPGTFPVDSALFAEAYLGRAAVDGTALPGGTEAESDVRVEHRRGRQTKARSLATLCRMFGAPPPIIFGLRRQLGLVRDEDRGRFAAEVLSYAVGVAFGRWDVRLAQHPDWAPALVDPFAALPACPLGQLVRADGLPATEDRIASEAWLVQRKTSHELPERFEGDEVGAAAYPVRVAWEGILVDDTSDESRTDGFLRRIDGALDAVLGARRVAWEPDLVAAVGATSLSDWLRSPNGFFDHHLAQYTKSKRQAPIYWPITTPSSGVTFWVYGPRMSERTLPRLVELLKSQIAQLDSRLGHRPDGQPADLELTRDVRERRALAAQLEGLVRDGYRPAPDDGTVITLAPLHDTFRHAKWSTLLKDEWKDLEGRKYEWAHLAMSLWPERVRKKCAEDRSIAIAHGLDGELFPGGAVKPARKASARKTKAASAQGSLFDSPAGDGA